jgi:hypothetical protein
MRPAEAALCTSHFRLAAGHPVRLSCPFFAGALPSLLAMASAGASGPGATAGGATEVRGVHWRQFPAARRPGGALQPTGGGALALGGPRRQQGGGQGGRRAVQCLLGPFPGPASALACRARAPSPACPPARALCDSPIPSLPPFPLSPHLLRPLRCRAHSLLPLAPLPLALPPFSPPPRRATTLLLPPRRSALCSSATPRPPLQPLRPLHCAPPPCASSCCPPSPPLAQAQLLRATPRCPPPPPPTALWRQALGCCCSAAACCPSLTHWAWTRACSAPSARAPWPTAWRAWWRARRACWRAQLGACSPCRWHSLRCCCCCAARAQCPHG